MFWYCNNTLYDLQDHSLHQWIVAGNYPNYWFIHLNPFTMSKTKRKICGALLQNRKVTPFIWITVTFTLLSDVMVAVVMAGTGWAWTVEISKDVSGGAYHSYYGLWYVCSRLDNGEGIQDCEPVSDHASFTGRLCLIASKRNRKRALSNPLSTWAQ